MPTTQAQPKGLYALLFAEVWERYSFYTMQTLLVLYLITQFNFNDNNAYALFGAFSALVYITPVIGGFLADRLLGYRRCIFIGSGFYIVGYAVLVFLGHPLFYIALGCIVAGNGFFKANVSALLGKLYEENDIRRESGFTLFYMGINIGSFMASIISALLMQRFGWSTAFGAAGLGMLLGMVVCMYTFRVLGHHGRSPNKALLLKNFFGLRYIHLIYIGTIACVFIVAELIKYPAIADHLYSVFGALVVVGLFLLTFRYEGKQRKKLIVLVTLTLISVIFWALYAQMFTSITLFTQRIVQRELWGWTIPAPMFIGLNPFFIILISPGLAWLWKYLQIKQLNPSMPMKFAGGILFISVSFFVLKLSILFAGNHKVDPLWLIPTYALQVIGELSLSAIGLAMITSLAPEKLVGVLMGAWLLAIAAGFAVGSGIAKLTAIPAHASNLQIAHIYSHNFLWFGTVGVVIGLIILPFVPALKKLMA
mgnify:CR=1 FL=1|tara:strand:+ start:35916 stop:37355 length:1440 start_codon:yes stop_codon:yes gene_type:complete